MKTRKSHVSSRSTATLTQRGLLAVLLQRQHNKGSKFAEGRTHRRQRLFSFSIAMTWLLACIRAANSGRSFRRVFGKPGAVFQQIHTYTELRRQIHDDLRLQHPNWVQSNGKSPICDAYEARLMQLIAPLTGIDADRVQKSPIV